MVYAVSTEGEDICEERCETRGTGRLDGHGRELVVAVKTRCEYMVCVIGLKGLKT